ncbi:hypothetical protein F4820DRAFT_378296 [Hypoxylon rubiginosum]|uniref:Uncharacterized protein n=1 Tax=Hypoxylon rubiginosum TaxID=110542 RepID=A0ACB9YV99_9PEZI|nr:hypothetical protein F4820DRAFT_378296 [Hypoxylon rubiginosum]
MAPQASDTSSETEVHFHLFRLLPPELRRKIYILATPPRVVLVQEDRCDDGCEHEDELECYETFQAFAERCRTTPVHFKLHPDIAYFAHNWRPRIDLNPSPYSQPTLESYGFTSARKRYQPWPPTEETPEIPAVWLSEHPTEAWAMARDAYLSSSAPIPPFLHVCSESREFLTNYGYELAFGTRTHSGRTWFNFKQDTLYLSCNNSSDEQLLSGGQWDVGLFRPADLLRVKKLALQGGMRIIPGSPEMNGGFTDASGWVAPISDLLWLLPNVQDLFFVEWGPEMIRDWAKYDYPSQYPSMPLEGINLNAGFENRYVCVPIDEIDTVATRVPSDAYGYGEGIAVSRLRRFKKVGSRSPFFEAEAYRFRELLAKELRKTTDRASGSVSGPRKVPTISLVHVCPLQMTRHIFAMRQQFWVQFLDTKYRLRRGKASKLEAERRTTESITYQDVGEAYLRAHEPDLDEYWEFLMAHSLWHFGAPEFSLPVTRQEEWWLSNASLFPPRFNVI